MIKEKLLDLPNEIKELRIEVLKEEKKIVSYRLELERWELMELDEIANEKDESGKVIYSNDMKRRAELERRKKINENYVEVEKMIDDLEYEIEMKKIELDKLYNEQKNLRAICQLEGGEIGG